MAIAVMVWNIHPVRWLIVFVVYVLCGNATHHFLKYHCTRVANRSTRMRVVTVVGYCRACAASDMGLSASVPLPIVMGIFVLLGFQSS